MLDSGWLGRAICRATKRLCEPPCMAYSAAPRGSKYYVLEASGPKTHTLNSIWHQNPRVFGTWTFWATVQLLGLLGCQACHGVAVLSDLLKLADGSVFPWLFPQRLCEGRS